MLKIFSVIIATATGSPFSEAEKYDCWLSSTSPAVF